jgi:hypothetical protein
MTLFVGDVEGESVTFMSGENNGNLSQRWLILVGKYGKKYLYVTQTEN